MGKRIWTYETCKELYVRLIQHFGTHMTWEKNQWPDERRGEYDSFCADFSRIIGASEKGGAQMQVNWAITKQEKVDVDDTFYRNKAAAYEAGFIDKSYLPKTILCEY